jgi:hypothetical protein
VQHGHDRAAFAMPAAQHGQQIVDGCLVDGGEGLVEQQATRIEQEQTGKQKPLQVADRQFTDELRGCVRKTDFAECMPGTFHGVAVGCRERAETSPCAQGHEIKYGDRERRIDLGPLRQEGDRARFRGLAADDAGTGPQQTGGKLQQGAFSGPVGADHRRHRARGERPGDVAQRKCIPERGCHILEGDGRSDG